MHTHIHIQIGGILNIYTYTHTEKRVKSRLNRTESPQKELKGLKDGDGSTDSLPSENYKQLFGHSLSAEMLF